MAAFQQFKIKNRDIRKKGSINNNNEKIAIKVIIMIIH